MFLLKFLLYFVSFVQIVKEGSSISGTALDCTIPIGSKQDYLAQWPLVYKPDGQLYSTIEDPESNELKIVIVHGDEVLLSCGPNYFKQFDRKEVLNAKCNAATGHFIINQNHHNQNEKSARDLTCDLRVIEEVMGDIPGCTDTTSRYGYVDPIKKKSFLLGEACYDMKAGLTKFVHFKLGDSTFDHLEEQPKAYLTTLRHPDGRYKIELFRGLRFDDIYERIRTTLNIRQIPELKIAHYVDEPLLSSEQFQAIKKLGWNYYVGYDENETLEMLKRDIKEVSKTKNLDVYIGSHGIKELAGSDGTKMEIYLHPNPKRFAMPDLLWFVIKSEEKATGFGIWNNADNRNSLRETENTPRNTKNFCKNSDCEKISWLSAELKRSELICCDVNEFRQNVPEVPVISHAYDMFI